MKTTNFLILLILLVLLIVFLPVVLLMGAVLALVAVPLVLVIGVPLVFAGRKLKDIQVPPPVQFIATMAVMLAFAWLWSQL